MSASRKDYIALANAARSKGFSRRTLERIADVLASSLPNFNRDRWIAYVRGECGPFGGHVGPRKRKRKARVHREPTLTPDGRLV